VVTDKEFMGVSDYTDSVRGRDGFSLTSVDDLFSHEAHDLTINRGNNSSICTNGEILGSPACTLHCRIGACHFRIGGKYPTRRAHDNALADRVCLNSQIIGLLLSELISEIVLDTHLADLVNLCFKPIKVHLFILEN
jgi:hypothetical protein